MNTNVITIASLRTMQTMLQSKGILTFHFLYPPRDCCQCIPFYGLQKYIDRELFSKMADSGNLLLQQREEPTVVVSGEKHVTALYNIFPYNLNILALNRFSVAEELRLASLSSRLLFDFSRLH